VTLLATLVATSQRVGATAARLAKVRELAECLRALEPGEIEIAVQYLSGEIPQGRFGIGYSLLQAAAADTSAAQPVLSIEETDSRLTEIASVRGSGSASKRTDALRALFSRATAEEQEFLIRLLVGELRQGALAGVMVDAIASATQLPVAQVRRAAMYSKHLGAVARVAMAGGVEALAQFQLELFSPVAPMLAQTAADVDEAVQALPVREVVLDGEAISFNGSGRPLPFQITMRRFGRKLDVEKLRAELPIQAFFFDCLRFAGRSIADRPTEERLRALSEAVPATLQVPRLITASKSDARDFYQAALAAGHEGVMAKALTAPYEAGNRGASWLKIKRAHTLDLVVLAAEWGHGRRTGKLSNLHLGALDPATGQYVMLGKTFKGLTDAMLEWQTREFLARETHRDRYTVYVRPEIVVEIAFSDLQASPRYPGGLALRLARVKRYREDKQPEEADSIESVRRIYAAQG
jgi:DNA ligase-1